MIDACCFLTRALIRQQKQNRVLLSTIGATIMYSQDRFAVHWAFLHHFRLRKQRTQSLKHEWINFEKIKLIYFLEIIIRTKHFKSTSCGCWIESHYIVLVLLVHCCSIIMYLLGCQILPFLSQPFVN